MVRWPGKSEEHVPCSHQSRRKQLHLHQSRLPQWIFLDSRIVQTFQPRRWATSSVSSCEAEWRASACTLLTWRGPSHQVMKLLTNDWPSTRLVNAKATATERRVSNIEKALQARVQPQILLPLFNYVRLRVNLYIIIHYSLIRLHPGSKFLLYICIPLSPPCTLSPSFVRARYMHISTNSPPIELLTRWLCLRNWFIIHC